MQQRASASFVAAALLHDVGHLLERGADRGDEDVDDRHEIGGAAWLGRFFRPVVTEPIRLHVAAKRYLCAMEPSYVALLAPDSIRSLALQGGAMTAEETAAFEREPHFADAVRLRRIDELAKDGNAVTPPLRFFLDRLPD